MTTDPTGLPEQVERDAGDIAHGWVCHLVDDAARLARHHDLDEEATRALLAFVVDRARVLLDDVTPGRGDASGRDGR